AAIVASAFIELGSLHPDPSAGEMWFRQGVATLEALCRDEFTGGSSPRGLLKNSCYSMPHREGINGATMFGDFYFIEALCRIVLPGRFRPAHPRITF
ncbi:MAG TPA: glycosyl hydrolase, partial [Paralcaligenes sp.]